MRATAELTFRAPQSSLRSQPGLLIQIQMSNSGEGARPHSRDVNRPSCASLSALLIDRGRREDRVPAGTRGPLCCTFCTGMHRGGMTTGGPRHPRLPCAGFTAYFALSPVSRALLPPSPARSVLLANLTPASGARTTRLRRPFQPRSSVAAYASTASHRAFVTTAIRPSHRVRRGELVALICPTG